MQTAPSKRKTTLLPFFSSRVDVLHVADEYPVVLPLHLEHLVLDGLEVELCLLVGHELLHGEVVLLQVRELLLEVDQLDVGLVLGQLTLEKKEIYRAFSRYRACHNEWQCNRSWSLLLLYSRTVELAFIVARSVSHGKERRGCFIVVGSLKMNWSLCRDCLALLLDPHTAKTKLMESSITISSGQKPTTKKKPQLNNPILLFGRREKML